MMQRTGAIVGERILVVDDEEAIREIVSSLLVSANYNCQQAGSGNEALAVLNSGERFDLISTDLMMADLDGLALLEKVNVQYPEIPVIFVTSVHDPSVALMCFRAGAYPSAHTALVVLCGIMPLTYPKGCGVFRRYCPDSGVSIRF
jgi:CheY-like chemotaxis protein